MRNELRLKILKLSCIYGGVFSLILVGLYVFFMVAFPGTVRYMPIQFTLLLAGIVVSGISLSSGTLGKPGITYTITLDASRIDTAEETTFLVPLPVDTSSGVVADVVDELTVIKGDAVWRIVDTEHGKALEVRTSTKCILYAEKKCGYMERDEREEWLQRYDVSMIHEMDGGAYDVWVYASNANATMYLKLWKYTGLRSNIHCLDNDRTSLDEGWQTVELEWSKVLCD